MPDGSMARVPNLPQSGPNLGAAQRSQIGSAWAGSGADYDAVRPSYPDWCVSWLLGSEPGRRVVEVGAGTGLFTRDLVAAGHRVVAVDPSASMLEVLREQVPDVEQALVGTGELTGLEPTGLDAGAHVDAGANSDAGPAADAVVAAQAWHWVDPIAAGAEAARLTTGSASPVLGLVWNQLDVQVPWVHRLARIMHAGDVHRDAEVAAQAGPLWRIEEVREDHWSQELSVEQVFDLTRTRAYWLRSNQKTRERVESNLRWYLHEHLGHQPGARIELPYRTLAVRSVRA